MILLQIFILQDVVTLLPSFAVTLIVATAPTGALDFTVTLPDWVTVTSLLLLLSHFTDLLLHHSDIYLSLTAMNNPLRHLHS